MVLTPIQWWVLGGMWALWLPPENKTPWEITASETFSWVPQYSWEDLTAQYVTSQKSQPGIEMFKKSALDNLQTPDLDQQKSDLENQKVTAYSEIIKYYTANNIPITPSEAVTMAKNITKDVDKQITAIGTEKVARMKEANQEAETQYWNLSNQYILARQNAINIEQEIKNEAMQRISNPEKIQDLMTKKEKADKSLEKITKQFKDKGIEQPEIILRKWQDIQTEINRLKSMWVTKAEASSQINQMFPGQEIPAQTLINQEFWWAGSTNEILYNVALNQYDTADWHIDWPKILADLKTQPEFQGLTPKQMSEKLIEEDNDKDTLWDMIYLSQTIMDKPDAMVDILRDKGFNDQEITEIVLWWTFNNIPNLEGKSLKIIEWLKQSLRKYDIKKSIIKWVYNQYVE